MHVNDTEQFLIQFYRISRPTGCVLLCVLLSNNYIAFGVYIYATLRRANTYSKAAVQPFLV